MKKQLLILLGLFLAFSLQAKVAYLLPNGAAYNGPTSDQKDADISGLPSENMDGVNQDPEWRAAQWFYDEYVKTNKGEFITVNETDAKYAEFTSMWIHLDRDGRNANINTYYPAAFVTKLRTYCANGGNLLVTKHASQLLGDGTDKLNRIYVKDGDNAPYPISPEYPNSGWMLEKNDKQETVEVKWYTSTNFHGFDNSGHALYNDMQGGFTGDQKNIETLLVSKDYHHTNNNCGIPRGWIKIEESDSYETRLTKINNFNSLNDCRIIGTWGNEGWMQYAGNIEFYPHGENFKGTILMVGLAAYSWCTNNFGYAAENVKRMTRNGINYLEGSAYWKDGEAPRDGKAGESYVCTPLSAFDGYTITLSSSDETVASFNGGTLTLHAPGTTTIKATYVGDGMKSCKTEIVLEKEITVTDPTFTWVTVPANAAVTEDKPAVKITADNGMTVQYVSTDEHVATVAADGKLTYRHAGTTNIYGYVTVGETTYKSEEKPAEVSGMTVNWTIAPAATACVGEDMTIAAGPVYGSAVAKFETTNCTYSDGKLHFAAAGEAKVKPYTEGFEDEKFWGEEKTINVSYKKDSDVENVITSDLSSDGYDGDQMKFMLLHPNMRGLDSLSYEVIGGNAANTRKVKDDQGATHLEFKADGTYTIRVTVEAKTAGETWEAGIYQYDKTVVFNYKGKTAEKAIEEIGNADLSSNGLTDGDFMILHPNMRGAEIGKNYTISSEAEDTAFIKEYNGHNRLVFIQPGTVTLTYKAVVPDWNVYAPAGTYEGLTHEVTYAGSNEAWPEVDYTGATYTRAAKHMPDATGAMKYGTICLPYPAKVDANSCEIFTAEKRIVDNELKSIVLVAAEAIDANTYYNLKAGHAYIYLPKAESMSFIATGTSVAAPVSGDGVGIVGTFTGTTLTAADANKYYLKDNLLYYCTNTGTAKLKPFSAYFDMDKMPEYVDGASAAVRIIPFYTTPGYATGVEETTAVKATKALVNGKLVIVRGARTYNINGAILK